MVVFGGGKPRQRRQLTLPGVVMGVAGVITLVYCAILATSTQRPVYFGQIRSGAYPRAGLHAAGRWDVPAQDTGENGGAEILQEACRASLVRYHAVLSDWISGREKGTDIQEAWRKLEMAEEFILIDPSGQEMDKPRILQLLLLSHGSDSQFHTQPSDIQLTYESPDKVNVRFLEHQHTRTKERLIRSTGICRSVPQATTKSLQVEWLRLEEKLETVT
ncbi:unnamed protein product [Ostreobium quekettii]|uniref:Uncharacterized protein n=1 Tax=Ostreobium quekettii TaxID=121088 RepID=A0A8S1JFV1_9CHLO|nr:unnamed protein product [Ostreobium quekettii]|eukprot:evm.model.scf_1215EXC.3 EVM.evm.TU.scf_1215EXC.3   scf_1215EXC:14355-16770(-)